MQGFSFHLRKSTSYVKSMCCGLLLPFILFGGYVSGMNHAHPVPDEQVILYTDRDAYVSGEELFYRVSLVTQCDQHSSLVYIALRNTRNEIINGVIVPLNHKTSYGSIYLADTLSTDFYQLIAYTGDMRNYPADCYYTQTLFIANRFDTTLENLLELEEDPYNNQDQRGEPRTYGFPEPILPDHMNIRIGTDKEVYGRREPVQLTVSAEMSDGNAADISVAVTAKQTIWPFLHEETDNGCDREAPGQWTGDDGVLIYPREKNGPVIAGKLINQSDDKNKPEGVRVILSSPDSLTALMYTHTSERGQFHFTLDPTYFDRDLYLTPDPGTYTGKAPEIVVADPFAIHSSFEGYTGSISAELPPLVRESQDIVVVQKAFETLHGSFVRETGNEKKFPPRLYSEPVTVIEPARYVPLDNFREIAREIMPSVRIRQQNENWHIRLLNDQTAYTYFDGPPGLFLNSMPVGTLDVLMDFTSEHIRSIEVHNLPWRYGSMRFDGILSVFTHDQYDPATFLPEPFYALPPVIMQGKSTYVHPDYRTLGSEADRVPDFRQLLYWNPQQIMNDENSFSTIFYTGDLEGTYAIIVRGTLDTGEVFQAIHYLEVKL